MISMRNGGRHRVSSKLYETERYLPHPQVIGMHATPSHVVLIQSGDLTRHSIVQRLHHPNQY